MVYIPIIKCYQEKEYGNYIITIDNSVFEMSDNANQPNGLNMYCGEEFQLNSNQVKELQLGDMPKGVLIGIIGRLIQQIELCKETLNHVRSAIKLCAAPCIIMGI